MVETYYVMARCHIFAWIREEFAEMCGDRSVQLQREIKAAAAQVMDLTATLNKANDDDASLSTQIEQFSGY